MDFLFEQFAFKLRGISSEFKRFLYDKIDWNRNPVIIKGARGTGKTYLALQYVKENLPSNRKVLFVSADHIYFSQNSLKSFIENFAAGGGEYLFIDDIHKYRDWQKEVSKVLNKFDKLRLILIGHAVDNYSFGNSIDDRAAVYELPGLSLREFSIYGGAPVFDPVSPKDILSSHFQLTSEISSIFDPTAFLSAYLRYGYYPFFIENRSNYPDCILQNIAHFLESDLTFTKGTDVKNLSKIRQLLWSVSAGTGEKPNITEISEKIGVTRGTLLQYLDYLSKGGILRLLKSDQKENSIMTKPDKIFLNNPNLAYLLDTTAKDSRVLNKTFLQSQIAVVSDLYYADDADFQAFDRVFESISKNAKNYQTQINSNTKIYAVDSLEIGVNNQIPLWIFGFMY